jgi:PKD repeat protein
MGLRRHGRLLSILACIGLLSWAWRAAPPTLTRGPYLQNGREDGVTLVCRTDASASLTLRYGELEGPPWEGEVSSSGGTTHVFELTGLRPETRYAYELAAGAQTLAGGDEHAFTTAPPSESRAPFRFLAWGDSGKGNAQQREVASWMERVQPPATFALGLGDLVYDDGAWEDYDPKLFEPYARLFRSTVFWPALGNHDVETENGAPYLDAFHLPTTSGAPGQPSGTERYYSFDHGMAHFTCLDSQSSSSTPGSAMYTWAEADLAHARARGKRWLFVLMHHPPYTRGTHDSTSESDLIALHDDLVPLFEAQGVDLVLTGHSHVYERSYLARNDAVLQSHASEYTKIGSPDGTVYLVTGCGGASGSGPLDHPLMARSLGGVFGFNVIDVSWSEVRGRFRERDGRTTDLFTLRKEADDVPPRVAALEVRAADELALVFDEPVRAGAGPGGAEEPARYALDGGASVLAVALDTDQSTVVLATTTLATNTAYALTVDGVADPAGHVADEHVALARAVDTSVSPVVVVPRGATWRYHAAASAPPAAWRERTFDDSGWSSGPAGFGFGDGDDATLLGGMQGTTLACYVRARFTVANPARVVGLTLSVDYDDGFVAFLNGVEVARANVPVGETHTTPASSNHEAGTFRPFDLAHARALLVAGENVLAVQGHNATLTGNDFSLHPELSLLVDAPGGPPVAVAHAQVRTANAPARLVFSGARSRDEDGPLAEYAWDFGDGSANASGAEVEHLFTTAGTYTVTLRVRDASGLEALDAVSVRVHAQGSAPRAALGASTNDAAPGARVSFDARGSFDPDGGFVSARWDFGEPASGAANHASGLTPSHTFAAAGVYVVTLVVTDDEGSSVTATSAITVAGSPSGGGGGGGGCSLGDVRRPGPGDPLLAALLVWALLGLARHRERRAALARA